LLAGWRPHRDVWANLRLPMSLVAFPAAKSILNRFGGLRFGSRNEHVVLEPTEALVYNPDLIRRCERILGRQFYPIGYQEHQDREPILVDVSGAVYIVFGDDLYRVADSFDAVLSKVARGRLVPRQCEGITATKWFVGENSAS